MPYPGVSPSQTAKVESCVSDLMADPKFKPRKKGQTKKSAAVAVCVSSIKNDKKSKDYQEEIFDKYVATPEAEDFVKRTETYE